MKPSLSCSRCGTALSAASESGLCLQCASSAETVEQASGGQSPERASGGGAVLSNQPTLADKGESVSSAADAATLRESKASAGEPSQHGTSRLKDFEIVQELGRGGMGVVFKARQISLDREVALKMILAGEFAGEKEIKRFHAEAEAAAHLDHPNIVSIYEIGVEEGQHFFSMQLVEGESLARQMSRFQKDPRAAAAMMVQIARAVHYAHQRGILHRDLKPGNILVDAEGHPHVTDFGLATRLQAESHLTLSGAILGTPSYMSPEQASGQTKHLSTGTDIYSLGSILFHMLAGTPPFTGDSAVKILRRVVEEEPPTLRSLVPRIDRDLETICLRCLEKKPAGRYGSAEALAEDLERWLRYEPILARRSTKREQTVKWIRRKPVIASLLGALLLVGTVGVAGVIWQWLRAEERLVRLNVVNGVRLAREGDLAGALLWYTEALRLDRSGPSQEDIHRIRIGSLLQQTPQLRHVWFHKQPVWFAQLSPDQGRLAIIHGQDATTNRFRSAHLRVWSSESGAGLSPVISFSAGRPRIYRIRYQAFSPDSRQLVTVQAHDTPEKRVASQVLVLNPTNGTPLLAPLEMDGLVSHVEFSRSGEFLVAAGHAGYARVWNLAQGGQAVGDFAHQRWVTTASFSPDGRHLLTGSMDKTAKLWDLRQGSELFTFPHGRFVLDAQFNHGGTRLVTAASDQTGGEFRVWDVQTGAQVCMLDNAEGKVKGVIYQATFSPDDRHLAVASFDSTVTLWDAVTGRMVLPPMQHNHGVLSARFDVSGQRVLSASFDTTARLWDTRSGTRLAVLNQCSYLLDAAMTADGAQVITASTDGMVRRWQLPRLPAGQLTLTHTGEVLHAEFSHDGTRVLTASADQTARLWDAKTGQPLLAPLRHEAAIHYATISPDDQLIVTASADGTARVWDAATAQPLGPPMQHSNTVWHAEFDRQGARIVTASGKFRRATAAASNLLRDFSNAKTPELDQGGQARVWDARTGQPLTPPLRHDDAVVYAAFHPAGDRVVTTSADRTARLWQLPAGTRTGSPMIHIGIVFRASFSPDGRWLATVTGGEGSLVKGAAELWNAKTGERTGRLFEHGDMVYGAEFSPNGRQLVTASEDGTARVWDAKTGRPITPPIINGSIALGANFSPDGRFVLTTSDDGATRIWDAANGELIAQTRLHGSRLNSARFCPDGTRILTASDDHSARIVPLPRSDLRLEDLTGLAQVLAARRIASQGTELEPLTEREFETEWEGLVDRFPATYSISRASP